MQFFKSNYKYFLFIIFFIILFLLSNLKINAQEKSRIGYVDIEHVLQNSIAKEIFYSEYILERNKLVAARKNAQDKYRRLRKKLRIYETLLGYSEYEDELASQKKNMETIEMMLANANHDLKKWEQKNIALLFDELENILEIIAEEENVDIIFSKEPTILYGPASSNFTRRVIDLLNEKDVRDHITGQ